MANQRGVMNMELLEKVKDIRGEIGSRLTGLRMIRKSMSPQSYGIDAEPRRNQRQNSLVRAPGIPGSMQKNDYLSQRITLDDIVERNPALQLDHHGSNAIVSRGSLHLCMKSADPDHGKND
jgi:hypothetical protein